MKNSAKIFEKGTLFECDLPSDTDKVKGSVRKLQKRSSAKKWQKLFSQRVQFRMKVQDFESHSVEPMSFEEDSTEFGVISQFL